MWRSYRLLRNAACDPLHWLLTVGGNNRLNEYL